MPLPLFIIIVLSFFGVLFGAWFYYRCTPEGRVKDAKSELERHQDIAKAANTMLSIQRVQGETVENLKVHRYDPRAQKFNPVKNLDKDYTVHPECADVPEVCPACGEYLLIDRCINRKCSLYED